MKKSTWKYIAIAGVILIFLIAGASLLRKNTVLEKDIMAGERQEETTTEEIETVRTQLIRFGQWLPTKERSLLGSVESQGDTIVVSKVSGTVKNIYASLGNNVRKGQILADFDLTNDSTTVAYQNALLNLERTKFSVQNSIMTSEESLRSAEKNLERSRALETTKASESFETMVTQAQSSQTAANQALEWADRIIGVSIEYKNIVDPTSRQVGEGNKLLQQNTVNQIVDLLLRRTQWQNISANASTIQQVSFAQSQLAYLRDMRSMISKMDEMIRLTPQNDRFSESNRTAFLSRAESFASAIDTNIVQLERSITSAQTLVTSNTSTIVSAQNQVVQAKASLELTKAQGQANIQGAENEVSRLGVAVQDQTVRAPFDGEITDVMVQLYQNVTPGTQMFGILSTNTKPKVVLDVTPDELQRIRSAKSVIVDFENGATAMLDKSLLSTKINTANQKIEVEFELSELPQEVLVGSLARIKVPVNNSSFGMVPLSAISFEPGGAEVLVLNQENKAVRKRVEVGRMLGDGIEIVSGIPNDAVIVQYRNRVNSGEIVSEIQ